MSTAHINEPARVDLQVHGDCNVAEFVYGSAETPIVEPNLNARLTIDAGTINTVLAPTSIVHDSDKVKFAFDVSSVIDGKRRKYQFDVISPSMQYHKLVLVGDIWRDDYAI